MHWPVLREELALHVGPRCADGQPSWTLHDPVRNQFFRLDWLTFEILSRWSLNDAEAIVDSIAVETTLRPNPDDVEAVQRFLADNQLIQVGGGDSAARLAARLQTLRGSWFGWLLHHYLFFRVPLWRPDRWLNRWQDVAACFYSPLFYKLTALAFVFGVIQVYRNWEPFSATLVETLSWDGLLGYALTLTGIKVLHELGHAFTAKRYGCRVPAMGVAFLVLWPVAYTDTNEVWRLSQRKQRLAVDAAGVATELLVAVWATLAWSFLPDGPVKTAAFMLATTTWIATLAVNSSPFMRFDGYFLLADWLDMPNLHARSFALARWHLRERLFDLGEEPPEYFSARKRRGLILFAWATWLYRLALFLGIAILVYHFFIKAVGIFLFLVEMVVFVALPFINEFKAWALRWQTIKRKRRTAVSVAVALACASLLLLPLPTTISSSGLLQPAEQFAVYAPAGARLSERPWSEGSLVPAGAVMLKLDAPQLDLQRQQAQEKVNRLRWQLNTAGFDSEQQARTLVVQQELAGAEAALELVTKQLRQQQPRAPFAGRLHASDPELKPGQWVAKHEHLATLINDARWQVETYLPEEAVRRIRVGGTARFYADGREGPALALAVVEIDQDATRQLANGLHALAFGGSVQTREKDGELLPVQAMYRVKLLSRDQPGALSGRSWRGDVVFHGEWEAPALAYLRAAAAVFWREAGF